MNKLRGILIGHDTPTRYHRLRRVGVPKQWLHRHLGLHPHIHMFCLDEEELVPLLSASGLAVRHEQRYPSGEMIHAKWVAVQSLG